MPEPKAETAARVADLKKREAELIETRNALRMQITGLIEVHITELKDIGFEYALVENGVAPNAKERKCGQCGAAGHSKATCPQVKK